MSGDIERRTITTQLADRIEAEVRSGKWTGEIPGKRVLAERYGVNVKTCAAAITILEQRGLIGPASAGRSREILAFSASRMPGAFSDASRLLVIEQSGGMLNIEDHHLARRMAELWEKLDGEVVWATVDFPRCKSPGPQLDVLIRRHRPNALLLFSPGAGWHRAASERLPFYMAGGPFEADLPISLGACAIDIEVKRLVKHLRGIGHHHILIPSEGSSERVWRSIVEGLEDDAGRKPEIGTWEDYCPRFPSNIPEAWDGYWKKAFTRLKPTAVIVFNDTDLLSLYGFCYSHGIRIPKDLSIVSLNYEPRFEWLRPRPCMMRYPVKLALAHFQEWIQGGLVPIGRKYFPLKMLSGESVSPWPCAKGKA